MILIAGEVRAGLAPKGGGGKKKVPNNPDEQGSKRSRPHLVYKPWEKRQAGPSDCAPKTPLPRQSYDFARMMKNSWGKGETDVKGVGFSAPKEPEAREGGILLVFGPAGWRRVVASARRKKPSKKPSIEGGTMFPPWMGGKGGAYAKGFFFGLGFTGKKGGKKTRPL